MADPRQVLRSATRSGRRVVVAIAGFTVLILGVALSVPGIPGPGLGLIIAGLAILATEFTWARRALNRVRAYAHQVADRVRGRRGRDQRGVPGGSTGDSDRAA